MKRFWQSAGVVVVAAALVAGGVEIAAAVGAAAPAHVSKTGVTTAGIVPNVSVPTPDESIFTSIAPCRIVDTRLAGGSISTSGRSFYVSGSSNFASQGGASSGCNIPASATAVAANLTATKESAAGNLTAYPTGGSVPTSSVLNYQKVSIANGLTLAVRPGTAQGLTVRATHPTELVIDITGYYAPQIAVYVLSGGTPYLETSRIVSITHNSAGSYSIVADRNIDACTASVTTGDAGSYASAFTSSSTLIVDTFSLSSGVPTLTDHNFNATVTC